MVFPGRFSTGCLRCRQRKVKCDEAKPSCRRCYIYGKECPGYTDQFHFRHGLTASNFSPEKQSARLVPSNRKDRTTGGRGGRRAVKQEEEEIPGTDVWTPPVVQAPRVSYDDVSLCYFVRRFVSPDGMDGFPGHLTFLPNMFDHYGQGVLEQATLSVAKMAAYNQFGGDEFRLQSYQTYGRAIRSLQDAIQQETDVTDDKVLASILLLCTLKDISGESTGDPNEHAPGLYYILEKRGVEQLATRRGVELFLLALIRLQVYSFLREDDSYSDPGGLASVIGLFDPLIRAMSMMSKTLALRHQLSKFVTFPPLQQQMESPRESSPPAAGSINVTPDHDGHASAVGACLETLEDFDNWDHEAATYWQSTFEGRTLPTALGEVGIKMTYCDPPTACTIILVRAARLILLLSLLTYHNMMSLADDGTFGDMSAWEHWLPTLHSDFHKTIDDILACVPFVLGDVTPTGQPSTVTYDGAGAIVITQPLRLVTYCAYSKPEQVEAARKTLERINAAIGIRSAVSWEGEPVFPSDLIGSPGPAGAQRTESPAPVQQGQNGGPSFGTGVL